MQSYITVAYGNPPGDLYCGWFAVLMEWNEELETYEPYTAAYARCETKEEAEIEAEEWAEEEGLPYVSC